MASALIHMAVANEVNKKLGRDNKKLLLGSIAPDISKLVGEEREKSHFQINRDDPPNLEAFLIRYKNYLNDDFVMGYYIHLYTDYLWFKYFIPEIIDKDKYIVTKLDGTKIKFDTEYLLYKYIYNDYTNLNINLIDEYNLDLKIFYEDLPKIDNIIREIPMDKLDVLQNKMSEIIENSKETKLYVFDLDNIKQFISVSTERIINNIEQDL